MGLVSTWLAGIGLSHAVPNFRAAGIVSPSDLAELELTHYEALGVSAPGDRKKLFYLVQRIKMAVDEENGSPKKREHEVEERHFESGGGGNDRKSRQSQLENIYSEDEAEKYEDDYCSEDGDNEDDSVDDYRIKTARSYRAGEVPESSTPPSSPSLSSESSDLPSPPREEVGVRKGILEGPSSSRDHIDRHGVGRSARLVEKQIDTSHELESRRHMITPTGSVVKASFSTDEDHCASTSSHATIDEHRSDNFSRGSKIMTDAVVKSYSSRNDFIDNLSRASGSITDKNKGLAKQSNSNKAAVDVTELEVNDEYEDDSEWDELERSFASSAKRANSFRNIGVENEFNGACSNNSQVKNPSASCRNSQRQKRYGREKDRDMYTASSSRSRSYSIESSDNESVSSLHSIGSSLSSRSARRRKSAPLVSRASSGASSTSTGRRKSSSVADVKIKTDSVPDSSSTRLTPRGTSKSSTRSFDDDSSQGGKAGASEPSSIASEPSSIPGVSRVTKSQERQKLESKIPNRSKIPNPSISSTRIGKKRLSTIPSERIAPMSPLLSLSSSQLDHSIGARPVSSYDDEEPRGRTRRTSTAAGPRRRSLSSSRERKAMSGSDSEGSAPPRLRATKASDRHGSAPESALRQQAKDMRGRRRSLSESSPVKGSSMRGRGLSTAGSSTSSKSRRSRLPAPSHASTSPKRAARSSPSPNRGSARSMYDNTSSVESYVDGEIPGANLNESIHSTGPVFVHGVTEDKSFRAQIETLREDNTDEYNENMGQFLLQDNSEDEEDEMRIRVIIRKRPMSRKEASRSDGVDIIHPLQYDGYGRILVYQPKTRVDLTKEVEILPFAFDNTFDEVANNVQIYERAVRNLIPGVFEGRWASVFAYGQTGSGKTFTMMGSNLTGMKAGNKDNSNLGLYYLAAQDMFYLVNEPDFHHLTVGASLFEIYGGKLFDLLNCRKPVKCLEDHKGKVCFPGLSEHPVSSASELMSVIEAGAIHRSTGTTSANADSSRSHAVLQLSLRKKVGRKINVEHGRLTFIDLAGSERGADTNKASRTTRLEGAEINTSLLSLKEVIRALATGDSMTHIPFRGSKLTQVLKESFVGKSSRSVMVACVAPNMGNCEHTLNTLRYADRVKERDAQTGHTAIAKASRIKKKRINVEEPKFHENRRKLIERENSEMIFSSTADRFDVGTKSSFKEVMSEASDGEDWSFDEEKNSCFTDRAGDRDSLLLDEVLDSSANDSVRGNFRSQLEVKETLEETREIELAAVSSRQKESKKKEAGKTLIATHRSIMSEMLAMVKVRNMLVFYIYLFMPIFLYFVCRMHAVLFGTLTSG